MAITQYNSSVRQMSQLKFNSMKNASGKIPNLANQIVMTNSEDTNTSCLRAEVVYDMTSSDASKNWGHTTGLLGGNTYNNSNINLDKYEAFKFVLDIYPNTLSDIGSSNMVVEMEHITLIDGKSKLLGNVPYIQDGAWSDTYFRYEIQIGQNSISCQFYWTGAGAQSNNTKYRITKIYGILKTPSMIYTGHKLFAGNGISIENGIISNTKGAKVLAYHMNGTGGTAITATTSSKTLFSGTITKVSDTSKLLCIASTYLQDNSVGWASTLYLSVGGNSTNDLTNVSRQHVITRCISDIPAGNVNYNLSIFVGGGNGSCTIPTFNNYYLVIIEVE